MESLEERSVLDASGIDRAQPDRGDEPEHNLQLLGMPLQLVSLTAVVAGPAGTLLTPLLGWISDRGSNPNRRKMLNVMFCSVDPDTIRDTDNIIWLTLTNETGGLLISGIATIDLEGACLWCSAEGTLTTDYVGKAIYGGNPEAEPGSDSLRNYQTGVRKRVTCRTRTAFECRSVRLDPARSDRGDEPEDTKAADAIAKETNSGKGVFGTGEGRMLLLQKLLLNAQMIGSEANTNIGQLYTVPNLQLLGMPLKLVSLSAVVAGPAGALLTPLLGWISDRGSNPNRRKMLNVMFCSALLVSGVLLVQIFCMLSTDYVGKAIYGGNPEAEPGSDSLRNYQTGVKFASVGFIVYYSSYLLASVCQKRVHQLLGMDPLSFATIYPSILALEQSTGLVSFPLWTAAVSGCVSIVCFLLVGNI
nr:hypothetical protein BaRGS_006967 [Batillaria attramentaria]